MAPRVRTVTCAILVLALGLPLGPRDARAVWSNSPYVNTPVAAGSDDQYGAQIASDGAGGAFVAWVGNSATVRVQHVDAAGRAAWTVPLGMYPTVSSARIIMDGAGGCIVAWAGTRVSGMDLYSGIYMQRLNSSGQTLWPGVPAWEAKVLNVPVPMAYANPSLVTDRQGGAFVVWIVSVSGSLKVGGGWVRADQSRLGPWTLCNAPGNQLNPAICSPMLGNAIVAWEDTRGGDNNHDIYGQLMPPANCPSCQWSWGAGGLLMRGRADNEGHPDVVGDGNGGAYLAWDEGDGVNPAHVFVADYDIGGTQLDAKDVGWMATANQHNPRIVSDAQQGAIVVWNDNRSGGNALYAQRVRTVYHSDGSIELHEYWNVGGNAVAPGSGYDPELEYEPVNGSTLVTWQDWRHNRKDVYAQKLSIDGAALWDATAGAYGVLVCGNTKGETPGMPHSGDPVPLVTFDGSGGAIVAWNDFRAGNSDIYAQHVMATGALGMGEPDIVAIQDVANDQGGKVHVFWSGSALDTPARPWVASYTLWRSLSPPTVAARLAAGATIVDGGADPLSGGADLIRRTGDATNVTYWEFVATVPARGQSGYAYMAATTADSMPGLTPWNVFFVDATDTTNHTVYYSAPDSGYSVDNLSPARPAPFVAVYGPGSVALHWEPNREPDLLEYRLYRGSDRDFTPGPGNLLAVVRDTGYVDQNPAPGGCYKLAAVDVHGNRGLFACYAPDGPTGTLVSLFRSGCDDGSVHLVWMASSNPGLAATLQRRVESEGWQTVATLIADGTGQLAWEDRDVSPGRTYWYRLGVMDGDEEIFLGEVSVKVPALTFSLAGARPNPASAGQLMVRFTLPSATAARLELYDVSGRLCHAQEVGSLGQGRHDVLLSPVEGLPAGLYVLRLSRPGESLTRKTIVIR